MNARLTPTAGRALGTVGLLLALGLAGCSGAPAQQPGDQSSTEQSPSVSPSGQTDGASPSQSGDASVSPSEDASATSEASQGESDKAVAPSSDPASTESTKAEKKAPVEQEKLAADEDSSKDQPSSWPSAARTVKKAETSGVDKFLEGMAVAGKPTVIEDTSNEKAKAAAEAANAKGPNVAGMAQDAALEELNAQFAENAYKGWTVSGKPVIKGTPHVVDAEVNGEPVSRVFVCLDSSAVKITAADGTVVEPASKPGTKTALQYYDLTHSSKGAVVVRHGFTEEPTC